jgi:hypothetical protein
LCIALRLHTSFVHNCAESAFAVDKFGWVLTNCESCTNAVSTDRRALCADAVQP